MSHSVNIFSNENRPESYEQDSLRHEIKLKFVSKNFSCYSRVGAGAASKFSPGGGAA
jgi:hypothetical protein